MKVKKAIKRLPRSNNGARRKATSFGTWQYQKTRLTLQAAKRGMSVSYYVNYLLWKDEL